MSNSKYQNHYNEEDIQKFFDWFTSNEMLQKSDLEQKWFEVTGLHAKYETILQRLYQRGYHWKEKGKIRIYSNNKEKVPVGHISNRKGAHWIKYRTFEELSLEEREIHIKNKKNIEKSPCWMRYDKYVWLQAGKEIKDGERIVHINGNFSDDRLENLAVSTNYHKFVVKPHHEPKPKKKYVYKKPKNKEELVKKSKERVVSNKRIFTEEQINWLIDQYKNSYLPCEELVKKYNKKFNLTGTKDAFKNGNALKCWASKNGIKRIVRAPTRIFSSMEQVEYVKELMQNVDLTWDDITNLFWERYGQGDCPKSLNVSLKNCMHKTFHEKRPKNLTKTGKFTKEGSRQKRLPLGAEVKKRSEDGKYYIWVKVNDEMCTQENRNQIYSKNWRPKQDVLWEQYYPNDLVGKNEIVIFLDGDVENFEKDNLKKISRRVHATLAKYQAHNQGYATKAMIDVIETMQIMSEMEKK